MKLLDRRDGAGERDAGVDSETPAFAPALATAG